MTLNTIPPVVDFAAHISPAPVVAAGTARVTLDSFGKTADGRAAHLYTLVNTKGMRADVTDYGAIIVRLLTPDRHGRLGDVALGFNTIEEYIKDTPYFGAVVGRYGNRIADGKFTLDGKTYTLAKNSGPCSLHGGKVGFDKVLWTATPLVVNNTAGLELRYRSVDGEEGYPGNLDVVVRYWLTNDNELKVEYHATTDQPTPVNLTQHSYFNLKGEGTGDILDHVLTLNAKRFIAIDAEFLPTGKLAEVAGTPLDFTSPHVIGERVNSPHEQVKNGLGYDHTWIINRTGPGLVHAATVHEATSGRTLDVWTEEPGVQFYCGNFLTGLMGKSGHPYPRRSGFCLETQHYPDSPNHPEFPSTIVKPGTPYRTTTVFKFSAK